jgi:6-phospho-beta-glucosidase
MKLSVIGASSVATLQLGSALEAMFNELASGQRMELSLYARDKQRLKDIAGQVASLVQDVATVTSTTSLDNSLSAADVILIQVRIGGLVAREFDETFPHRASLPGEETLGPGGFANALRTVPVLESIFSRIAELAPDAFVVVLTNPAGIVRQAASSHGLNVVEVCEAPHALLDRIAERLECRMSDLLGRYVGMNHVGFYVPKDDDDFAKLLDLVPIDSEQVIAFGAVPLSYVRYYVDPNKYFMDQCDHPSRAEELMALDRSARDLLEQGGSPNFSSRPAPWYALAVVPVLRSLFDDERTPLLFGTSNDGRLTSLPSDATIEGAATVDRSGIVATSKLPLVPPLALELLERHARYEHLALDACRDQSEENLIRALRANPMIHDDTPIDELVKALMDAKDAPMRMNPR